MGVYSDDPKAYLKDWHAKNRDKDKLWRENNPDKVKANNDRNNAKRRHPNKEYTLKLIEETKRILKNNDTRKKRS